MKVTVAQIVDSEAALKELVASKFVASLAFKLKKITKKVSDELVAYNEVRESKIKEFGEKEGEQIKVKEDRIYDFLKEMDPVLKAEVEFDFDKISVESLSEAEKASFNECKISPVELFKLDWLLDC